MKRMILSLVVLCAAMMVACGNAEVDMINKLVTEATEKTLDAESVQDVVKIAQSLQAEMDKIAAKAGNKLSFGKSADEALARYQQATAAKLAEFGIDLK